MHTSLTPVTLKPAQVKGRGLKGEGEVYTVFPG
jgi:hypothetical protein